MSALRAAGLACCIAVAAPAAAWADSSRGGPLEVEVVELRMPSPLHTAMDVRYTNASPDDIRHWAIGVEVYDREGGYLARGEGMISRLRAGESKVGHVMILDTQASDIASWKISIIGIVGYSGFREDNKYSLRQK